MLRCIGSMQYYDSLAKHPQSGLIPTMSLRHTACRTHWPSQRGSYAPCHERASGLSLGIAATARAPRMRRGRQVHEACLLALRAGQHPAGTRLDQSMEPSTCAAGSWVRSGFSSANRRARAATACHGAGSSAAAGDEASSHIRAARTGPYKSSPCGPPDISRLKYIGTLLHQSACSSCYHGACSAAAAGDEAGSVPV